MAARRRRRLAAWEWVLLAAFVVLGIPSVIVVALFAPLMFAIQPGVGLGFVAVVVAGCHAPFRLWIEPRHGPRVALGCTGATVAAVFLVCWLVLAP